MRDKGYKLGARRGFDEPLSGGSDETVPKFAHHDRCIAALEANGGYLSLSERRTARGHVISLPLVRLGQAPPVQAPVPRPKATARTERASPSFPPIVQAIMRDVCAARGITRADLLSKSRKQPISHARQEVMAKLYGLNRFSLPKIGGFLGGLDHTTVIYGIKAAAKREAEAA
jgi:hypothetical protein